MVRKWKRIPRFPRLDLSKQDIHAQSILHATYNSLARDRTHYEGYDLYRTRVGFFAPIKFAMLGQILIKQKIDPAIYLKVMCRYGAYRDTRYLPHPSFLCSEKALEIYEWLHKSERKKYEFKEDWQKSIRAGKDEDIYYSLKNSALMVKDVRNNFSLKIIEAVMMLKSEISPWYWAWVIASVKKKRAEELLEWLVAEEPELKKKVMASTRFYVQHLLVWKKAKKIIGKYL